MPWTAQTVASGKSINPVALTTSNQTIYTAPAYSGTVTAGSGTGNIASAKVVEFIACNTNASSTNVTIYKVPNGGSPGASNAIWSGVAVNANDTKVLSGINLLMAPGDTIQASASATGVTLTISVVEYA